MMSYRHLSLSSLIVNRGNDRHGELENETASIAWLFNNREQHMRNLARDIVKEGQIYEPPLVSSDRKNFIVFDGNRRVTCLKLIASPKRAPSTELQVFFEGLKKKTGGAPSRKQFSARSNPIETGSTISFIAATPALNAASAKAPGTIG